MSPARVPWRERLAALEELRRLDERQSAPSWLRVDESADLDVVPPGVPFGPPGGLDPGGRWCPDT